MRRKKIPKETFYNVHAGRFVFGASIKIPVKVLPHFADQYQVGFGGSRKCIDITVDENDEVAWLTGIKHKDACALNGKLPSGDEQISVRQTVPIPRR
jgi:hypothetical protein